jgi:hypothetical protein
MNVMASLESEVCPLVTSVFSPISVSLKSLSAGNGDPQIALFVVARQTKSCTSKLRSLG